MAREQSIFRITPCSFCITDALGTCCPPIDAELLRTRSVEKKVGRLFVVHESAALRIEVDGVTHGRFIHADVVMEEDAHIARTPEEISDDNLAKEDGAPVIDDIVAEHLESETLVPQPYFSHHRVGLVAKIARPSFAIDPRELAIRPHAEALQMSAGVIRHSNMRPVEVAHAVEIVERDEHLAVAYGNIAGHCAIGLLPCE